MVSRWTSVCLSVPVCPSVSQSYVRPSVRLSFPDDDLSKHQWMFTYLVCALTLWRSGLAGRKSALNPTVVYYGFSFTLAYSRISHEYSPLFIIVINLMFVFSL